LKIAAVSFLSFFLFISACEKQVNEKEYVARIGDSILTEEDIKKAVPSLTSYQTRSSVVQEIVQNWIQRELLFLEAVDMGLAQDENLEKQVDDYRKVLYGNAYLGVFLSNKIIVTMDEVREQYKNNRDEFRRFSPEARLVHFLLNSEGEAVEVKKSLLKYDGEARQNLLSSYHVDVKTVKQGDLLPVLDKELFGSRPPRGVLGPFKSTFGYHVLEVYEFYPKDSYRGIDEVYDELSQQIFRLKSELLYVNLIDSLKSVYYININPDFPIHD